MTNLLTAAWAALVRLVRPDVDAIIAAFIKAQSKLEALANKELDALAAEAQQVEALLARRVERNAIVNRAYRIIHNIDGLVA
jgi:hypothetical protein